MQVSRLPVDALKATLARSQRASERFPVPDAAREICQPGSIAEGVGVVPSIVGAADDGR